MSELTDLLVNLTVLWQEFKVRYARVYFIDVGFMEKILMGRLIDELGRAIIKVFKKFVKDFGKGRFVNLLMRPKKSEVGVRNAAHGV